METLKEMFNLERIESIGSVDQLNGKFYSKYNYPWPPAYFQKFQDGQLNTRMLNQEIGSWETDRIRKDSRIWVAGCGTNQALFTALRFPEATVLGTDVSKKSIEVCRKNIANLGMTNVHIEEKSINEVDYEETFDYILCTGVIHHNADPENTLRRIARALKPGGVLELMVYNYYHRFHTTAFQKAMQVLDKAGTDYFDSHIEMATNLIDGFPEDCSMKDFLESYKGTPEAKIADALIQPVEYSYTVSTLKLMLANCHLEYLAPCICQFDKDEDKFSWNIDFAPGKLKQSYESLADAERWQVTNLLLQEKSPMLWFYCQRKDSGYTPKPEQVMCEEFLHTRFKKAQAWTENFVLNNNSQYSKIPKKFSFPVPNAPSGELERNVYNLADGWLTMGQIFQMLGISSDFSTVLRIKNKLTTPLFPYLTAG